MIGAQERWQEDLFVAGLLSSLIPEDHILKRVNEILDLSWLREEVKELYCTGNGRPARKRKPKKRSKTDLEATMTTSSHSFRMEPCYKQHGAVDDLWGVIVDVDVTTGEQSEGSQLPDQIERIQANTGIKIETLSADCGFAHGKNYELCEKKKIDAVIPPQKENSKPKHIPLRRFKYDARNKIVKCPAGKILTRRTENEQGWIYRANAKDCRQCPARSRCIGEGRAARTVLIDNGYEALLRARRRHARPDKKFKETLKRHRWKVEGMHGEAKTQHGLRRAVRRGLVNVAIQAYLTAVVINLKRLAAFAGFFALRICPSHPVACQSKALDTTLKMELASPAGKKVFPHAAQYDDNQKNIRTFSTAPLSPVSIRKPRNNFRQ